MRCWFCEGDASEPNHGDHCDGRQGKREAAALSDLPLFDNVRPVSHADDPSTSHLAEAKLRQSGRLGRQLLETLARLVEWPSDPPTSRELGGADVRQQYICARRLTDLRELGYVENGGSRVCRRTGEKCLTWRPTPAGRARVSVERKVMA